MMQEVECTTAEFSYAAGWDGVPFKPLAPWLDDAVRSGKIVPFEPGADYAGYWVDTPDGKVFATAGDKICRADDGVLTVKWTGHWQERHRPKWRAPDAND